MLDLKALPVKLLITCNDPSGEPSTTLIRLSRRGSRHIDKRLFFSPAEAAALSILSAA